MPRKSVGEKRKNPGDKKLLLEKTNLKKKLKSL